MIGGVILGIVLVGCVLALIYLAITAIIHSIQWGDWFEMILYILLLMTIIGFIIMGIDGAWA